MRRFVMLKKTGVMLRSITILLFACSAVGAKGCFDDWGTAGSGSSGSSGGGTVIRCLPTDCDLVCNGTSAYPLLNGACSVPLSSNTVVDPGIKQWLVATLQMPCPTLDRSTDMPVHLKPPAQYTCKGSPCPTNPNKLPTTCVAVCEMSNMPPDTQGCPDPATNTAMAEFLMTLNGITCNDQATTNPYTLHPDPSLVDTSTCL
jgi:hypothetical protein